MTFTTITFLFFLFVVFSAYWLIRHRRAQNALLVFASYLFYGWWDWRFCGLMLAASLLDFAIGIGLEQTRSSIRRRVLLSFGLSSNLGILGFFKYFNFFAESLQDLAGTIGWQIHSPTLRILLPVGISFYTFQTMSYTIDVYRRKLPAARHLIEYLAYVSFFPQLVAGPIERATNLLPQFYRDRVFDHDNAVDGCRQMLWGFFKKMVVADNLAPLVDRVFSNPSTFTGGELAIGTVMFAFQIYCDFSAYSDIAIGVARLFGFQLTRNFAYPYFSQSIAEFWRRWHISLTTWFKDYVYIPLGGNRVSRVRRALNIVLTFLLSGLWHGASWNFVAWGGLGGISTAPETLSSSRRTGRTDDVPGGESAIPSPKTLARMLLTFAVVCLGWVFFRANTLSEGWHIVRTIISDGLHFEGYFLGLAAVQAAPLGSLLLLVLGALIVVEWIQRRRPHPLVIPHWPQPIRWATYFSLTVAILLGGTLSTTQFIYFQF